MFIPHQSMQDLNELEVYTSGAFDWQQTEQ